MHLKAAVFEGCSRMKSAKRFNRHGSRIINTRPRTLCLVGEERNDMQC
jgi:hypothetical protein